MSGWSSLLIVVAVAATTYVMRAGVIVAIADRTLPTPVERALRNVGPAVLAALALNLAASGGGAVALDPDVALALVASGVVAWWRRSVIWALAAGMVVLWVAGLIW